jgi:hypothetical protein
MCKDRRASQKARAEFLIQQTRDMAERDWEPKLRASIASLGKSQTKQKLLDPKQVAARGPVLRSYGYYAELSADAAHPTLDALWRYQDRAQENGGTIWNIDINPLVSPEERRMTLMLVCEALLGVCVEVMEILDLRSVNEDLSALMQEYQALNDRV